MPEESKVFRVKEIAPAFSSEIENEINRYIKKNKIHHSDIIDIKYVYNPSITSLMAFIHYLTIENNDSKPQ